MNNNPLISVVIPVYNGANYLEKTIQTIIIQSYKNIEILLIDDSSTDESFAIISKFASIDARCKVYKKENGGMVSKSLNFIKPFVSGDFFFYVSQDDLLSIDLFEKMINRYFETKADTILPDMEFYYENELNPKKIIGLNGNRTIELSGNEAFVQSINWNIHGFALFKIDFLKNDTFPEDAFDADEFITRKWFLASKKVAFSEGTFFYRQDNTGAITKSFDKKNFYSLNTKQKLFQLIISSNLSDSYTFAAYYDLVYNYYHILKKYKGYNFKNKTDKNEITLFLKAFKQQNFNINFTVNCIKIALKEGKIKFLVVLLVIHLQHCFLK